NKILSTIHIYPTRMEAVKFAAGNWKKANTKTWQLKLLKRFHAWQRK
ncbi:MAG: pyridine nucleotide-disulfide oxidoreductase, partial [Proteobacteria bacterium]|nr:pyridine nucleotide-disulfide oxidoreductase [Pseudomonadota bacterium]